MNLVVCVLTRFEVNMATVVDEIVIENVGPVEQLHIPLPDGGGVVVLP